MTAARSDLMVLKPCPFCGAMPHSRIVPNPNGTKYPTRHQVWCENLDCAVGAEADEDTYEGVIAAWNTRAASQPDREAIAAAYEAGAIAVHNHWCDSGESLPPGHADFSEAANDYAISLLSGASTKSDGGVEGHAEASRSSVNRVPPAEKAQRSADSMRDMRDIKCAAIPEDRGNAGYDQAGIKPGPSDTAGLEDGRSCTCHPDDNAPRPCPHRYALSDCISQKGKLPLTEDDGSGDPISSDWKQPIPSEDADGWVVNRKRGVGVFMSAVEYDESSAAAEANIHGLGYFAIRKCRPAIRRSSQSAPPVLYSLPSGEIDPSVMPDSGGADTKSDGARLRNLADAFNENLDRIGVKPSPSDPSPPAPSVREALETAARCFEQIRLALIHELREPARSAFWKAVDGRNKAQAALSSLHAVAGYVLWPEPKITNPDIINPTGIPYIDGLIHQVLDAQQDVNFAANTHMDQSLCDAAALLDEVEGALRRVSALSVSTVTVTREDVARVLFERKPTRHPDGRIPTWDNQPENIRASYYGDADAILSLLNSTVRP